MNDRQKPSSSLRRLRRWLRHPFTTQLSESRELYSDILRQAAQTQSLDDLLERFPERICAALELSAFHTFILNRDAEDAWEYRLLNNSPHPMTFPASSATVARMKRERRPSSFASTSSAPGTTPEAWQLLATPDELTMLEALGTQLLFPLEGRTRLIGFVSLARPGRRPFTFAELRFLQQLGPEMGRGLETALLVRRLSMDAVERDRSLRELFLAREVQEHLLPGTLPTLPGLTLAASYRSAEQVGGDYYDAFLTRSGTLCLVIADVSGKGVPAALVMAALRASLHALILQPGLALAPLVAHLNDLFFGSSTSSRYATLFVALVDPATGTLEYCNAGHNPPALLRVANTVEPLTEGGSVLGLFPQATFTTHTTPFRPGDALILYTDGITEAVDPAGQEWSEPTLHQTLRNASEASTATSLIEHIEATLADFTQGTPPVDDMTLLVLTHPKPSQNTLPEA